MTKNLLRFLSFVAALNCCCPLPAFAVVNSATRSTEIAGASQTVFTVPFAFSEESALKVTKILLSTGVGTVLTINTDYTVKLPIGTASGRVTTTAPVTSLYKLRIERTTPLTQLTAFTSQGAYFPQLHEKALDKLTMAIQDNPGGGGGGGSGVTDGDKGDIIIGSVGTLYTLDPTVVTSAGRALIDDADATAQRLTLGLGTLATQNGTFSGTHSGSSSGTNTGDQIITLTGPVTGSGAGSFATTITNDAVDNSKLSNMPANTVKCRITASTGDPEDCTAANVRTIITQVSGSSTAYMDGTGNFTTPAATAAGWKLPVRAASTANIASMSGGLTIDGVSVSAPDRVLVKNQSTASQNGIYVVAGGSWTRATDMDGFGEASGALVYVQEGSTQADTAWSVTTDETITIGSSSITFSQFAAGGGGGGTPATTVQGVGSSNVVGVSTNYAREDHVHAHGSQSGSTDHAIAVANVSNGFMSSADKSFVELLIRGIKPPVRVATTANITLSGTQTIDGVSVVANDRVLVKNQSTAANNGIYNCAAGSWNRVSDMDSSVETVPGLTACVSEGAANADTCWILTTDAAITLGSTSLTFAETDHKAVLAGAGLTRSGNTLSVNTSQNISTLSNLTSNGFVKTSGGTGALSIDTSNYITGNQTITLSSDVTGSGTTAITATIANNAVTNAKAADMATARIKGRVTAATGDPEDLTGTQATTLLDTFTSSLKGLAPASGGGTTNFLRADGTWAAPPGGGSSTLWYRDFAADQFVTVGTGWPTTTGATGPSTANEADYLSFSNSADNGVGLDIVLPTGAANITMDIDAAPASSGFTTNNGVQWSLACKTKYSTGSYTTVDASAITFTDNALSQRKQVTWTVSGLSLTAGTVARCELFRDTPDADDTLSVALRLLHLQVTVN